MHWLLLASWSDDLFQLVVEWSYLGVFLLLLACGLGFPCPEEVALIGGGYAVFKQGGGWGAVMLMVSVAMIGVLVGDVILWSIGRRLGEAPHRVPFIGRHLTPPRMRKARALFRRHGAKAVFFGRFLFGIRAVTFFVSGSLRVPLTTFVIMDGLGALLSVPISVILAWHFGAQIEEATAYVRRGNRIILVVIGVVAAVVIVRLWQRRGDLAALAEGDESGEDPPLPRGDAPPLPQDQDQPRRPEEQPAEPPHAG